jgi:Cu(I)/Ag(I) efflux system membrane fusion protein
LPGSSFEGRVSYIDPFINPSTRVAKVRIELPNKALKLKPEMFANGVLHSKIAESSDQLLIPKSSILWTGKRAIVYVRVPERESPSFLYRQIKLGPEAGDSYVVAEGLREGEAIAVNGVFKIDAAAQLEGKPSMMNPGGGRVSTGHDHGSMSAEVGFDEADHSEHQSMEAEQEVVEVKAEFKNQLQDVYNSYIIMSEALVASDAQEAGKAAAQVESSLKEVDMSLLDGEAHILWMKHLKSLESEIRTISTSSDISTQRISFAAFNVLSSVPSGSTIFLFSLRALSLILSINSIVYQ